MFEDIGRIIQQRREDLHISPKELARNVGISAWALRRIERGTQVPKWGLVLKLLEQLDLTIKILCKG